MKYRALISFSGVVSMAMGEEREIEDPVIVNDLLKAGYIAPVREMSDDRGPLGEDEEKTKKKGGKKK